MDDPEQPDCPEGQVKPLQNRMRQLARETRTQQLVIEKDYALSYVLAGIASQPSIAKTLIFKGGTALKKMYFGNYRFSEDLDFSTIDAPKGADLEGALRWAVEHAGEMLNNYGPFTIQMERYEERDPHPGGQEAFIVRVQFPWQRNPHCRIKIEVTHEEPVLLAPDTRPLIHGYEEDLVVEVRCYVLEEIVVEKMRSLLQTHQKLVKRGWNRPRARDYYDLWRVLETYGDNLKREQLADLLQKKCEHRNVSFISIDDFFSEELVSEAHRHWDTSLRPFVSDLPASDVVLRELKSRIGDFFPSLVQPDS
jgi:predicted nucleotidyltransferase component of viral defense system